MSEPSPMSITGGIDDNAPHVYATYYVSGILALSFSTWLLIKNKSPLNFCHWNSNENQCKNRYFNGASFYILRGASYIAAGIIAQFCPPQSTGYYILWPSSIILHDLSLLYLLSFIGIICRLNGWTYCPVQSQLRFGKTPIMYVIQMLITGICVSCAIVYDIVAFTKHAGIILESLILIYFAVYVMIDGCYSFDGEYVNTIWLYIDYILITWLGFGLLVIDNINVNVYIKNDMNFVAVYNIINCVALILLFAGILNEKRINDKIAKSKPDTVLTPASIESAYESDKEVGDFRLDFNNGDMVSLIDD